MNTIEHQTFDSERALYHLCHTRVKDCTFAGPADGESVLKETRAIEVDGCSFSLRYPLWHAKQYSLRDSQLDEKTRAALWYSDDGIIEQTGISGVKALRECSNTVIRNCRICSPEFGWKTDHTTVLDSRIESEYIFLDAKHITAERLDFKGKYSFQQADIIGHIDSVKNPRSGRITADSIGAVIREDPVMECSAEICLRALT